MVIVTTGMLYGENINPKKSLKDLSKDKSHKLFSLNTIAPAIVTKHFLSKLNKENKYIFSLRIV